MYNRYTLNISLGKFGENLACEYLVKNGYKILQRNYRKPWGEIDIVAREKDNTLVFVEVKTLRDYDNEGLKPEDNLSSAKLRKLQRTCQKFAAVNPDLVDEEKGWRIDLLAMTVDAADSDNTKISHYKNI